MGCSKSVTCLLVLSLAGAIGSYSKPTVHFSVQSPHWGGQGRSGNPKPWPGLWRWVQQLQQQAQSSSSNSNGLGAHQARRIMLQDDEAANNSNSAPEEDPTQRSTWDAEPSYASHYRRDDDRPNMCKIAHRVPAPIGRQQYNFTASQKDYVPFIGTSVVRDSQLLLLRLFYSIDYPVKWFVVVVGEQVASGKNAIAYEVDHLVKYPQDKVGVIIITCEHQPAVTESWNAVFQTFKDEPWGVYMARDTFWERGALQKLSPHGWEAAETGSVDVGFMKWSNMGEREAVHNIFMMTSRAVKRFGLWDENIYPALCEDIDMGVRGQKMNPPLKEHWFQDVMAVHGKRTDDSYWPGAWLPDDPHVKEEKALTHYTVTVRHGANCNYLLRKWGCPGDSSDWMRRMAECSFKTPFNKSVPVWYWHSSKALRARDRWMSVQRTDKGVAQLLDFKTKDVVFDVPKHYGEWQGYFEKSRLCRLSGLLGRITGPDGRTMCL